MTFVGEKVTAGANKAESCCCGAVSGAGHAQLADFF